MKKLSNKLRMFNNKKNNANHTKKAKRNAIRKARVAALR